MSKKVKPPLSHAKMVATGAIRHKSKVLHAVHFVWDTCEKMTKANPAVTRKALTDACLAAGVAFYTARTQIQAWRSAGKAGAK